MPQLTPDKVLSNGDPGDDTQRRYYYQAGYAAIIAIDLLNDSSEFDEVFCEHHEDILIRKKDGTFIGVQVKTRTSSQETYKSNDEDIVKSIKRFVRHDIEYPGCYSRFVIATNHSFWAVRKEDGRNLEYILNLAKEGKSDNAELLSYVNKINKLFGCSPLCNELIINVLSRIEIEDNLPKFDDMKLRIAECIKAAYDIKEAGYYDLLLVAEKLNDSMFKAGSLHHTSPRKTYFALLSDPKGEYSDLNIDGKRVSREAVKSILEEELLDNALLCMREDLAIKDLPKGMKILELKMTKGNISAKSIDNIKDLKYSTEVLLNTWMHKKGSNEANKRYEQLRVIISNECQEAHDKVYASGRLFGLEMLNDVRQHLRIRKEKEPDLFFNCEYEHLLGVVGILTEQCDVWWSVEFDIPEGIKP